MEVTTLNTLAQRVRAKFGGRYPNGISASDCYQDAIVLLLELEKQKDRVPAGVDTTAWLVTRAHGDLRDQYARQWRAAGKLHVVAEVDGGITDDYRAPDQDVVLDVRAAVAQLEGLQKQCMLLTLEGKTQEQIAAIIGHTQPSVSQIMTRAKQRLKELLPGYGEEERCSVLPDSKRFERTARPTRGTKSGTCPSTTPSATESKSTTGPSSPPGTRPSGS